MRGKFLVLEGIDGAGKSTHLDFICDTVRQTKGVEVVLTREPGGTPLAEELRQITLHRPMDAQTEVLLVFAARRDHVAQVIAPALAAGKWVVCDRFTDSTRAYQGGGGGVSLGWIEQIASGVVGELSPDRVYLFDAPATLAAQRRNSRGSASDRFEAQDTQYFDRVRQVYLQQAQVNSQVYRVIDSALDVSRIQKLLQEDILTI